MKLAQLLKPWIQEELPECSIRDLKNDSRLIQPGDLFLAYPGAAFDGRLFIQNAIAAGATALVYEPALFPSSCVIPESIPCIALPHLVDHLAEIAQRFYGNPGEALIVTGVTGTNGKTSIAYQLAQAHQLLGQNAAYIGTIGEGAVYQLSPLNNTTPDALCLQQLFSNYKKQNIKQVCMEVSSHALCQHRVDAIEFDQAIFTNLSLDHLDYHQSMQAYAQAKALLFKGESLEWAIINQDDAYQSSMSQVLKPQVKKISYGMHQDSDVKALSWNMDINGTIIEVSSPWGLHQLKIQASGLFNIYNSLAIFTSLLASGYNLEKVIEVMAQLKAAPGRMEIVKESPYVFVDYAHTPDALEKVLIALNQLKTGRLWVVFGCGGDRDKSKRPVMGKVASLYADQIVITSDNPRNEDPLEIIAQIAAGMQNPTPCIELVNREEAIAHAVKAARPEDIILIAGKGHEDYQQIGASRHVFSDKEVVKRLGVIFDGLL